MIKMDETYNNVARIKVVGVGGAGGNAVNRMVRSGFTGVEFITINTDQLALDNSLADVKLSIGSKITKGLGAGARPERGFQAIQEDRAAVEAAIEGADMVFITAGMGGGTGTGAAPVVAEICREKGILSVAVVTKPFVFEGPVRDKNCKAGFEALRRNVDTIIVIQNQKILSVAGKQTQVSQAFKLADEVLSNAVRGICDIILQHGSIQVDFADVKTVMENGGDALMGTGVAEGEGRAQAAAERAIHSPLLDEIDISGASGVLVNISHSEDFSIHELNEVMSYIYEAVGEENQPNIIFGHVQNEEADFAGKVSVTVIAAGFHKDGQAYLDAPAKITTAVPVQAPAPATVAMTATVAAATIPSQSWDQYTTPAPQMVVAPPQMETMGMPAFMSAPTIAVSQQVAQPVAASMAPVMAPMAAPQIELPNPFMAPNLDVRRRAVEEMEFRPSIAQAPQPAPVLEQTRPDPARIDALWDTPRAPQVHTETSHHRKTESRNSGAVSVHEFYNQPMDDDQDRDVPAFLRNPF